MTDAPIAAAEDPGPFGSSFDSFLQEEGILEEVHEHAIKALIADQLNAEIQRQQMSISGLARHLKTSRSQLRRLLDRGTTEVTLGKLDELAASLGKRIHIELVDAGKRGPAMRAAARTKAKSSAAPRRRTLALAD